MAAIAKREPYFVHDQERGTWQLLSGTGNPLTAPRPCGCASIAGEEWRAAVLAKAGQTIARVRCAGEWIGQIDARGRFTYSDGGAA